MTIAQALGPAGEIWATAPDESWLLRGQPWPTVGAVVEICWASRFKDPVEYGYARAILEWTDGYMSKWANEAGDRLVFNPDFWRAAHNTREG